MPRRITSSQLRSKIRQAESKRRQAINDYNRKVREFNSTRRRSIDAYNREVQQYNSKRRRAIDSFNREVRQYNSRVRVNQARLQSARTVHVQRQPSIGPYFRVHQSATELSEAYDLLDRSSANPYLSDLAERDTTNSLVVVNSLLEDTERGSYFDDAIGHTKISAELSSISLDLNNRWLGALYALDPRNPDAARHFCTSSREIIAYVLNTYAPDAEVLAYDPNCELTDLGTPSRRAKIIYCLDRLGEANDELENFIDVNVRDLTILFRELNAGAHGSSDKFTWQQMADIKTRVEDAIAFVCKLTP